MQAHESIVIIHEKVEKKNQNDIFDIFCISGSTECGSFSDQPTFIGEKLPEDTAER